MTSRREAAGQPGAFRARPAKPRFARVPRGVTCGFCTVLASRGAVYHTAETAGELGQFHGGCDCPIVLIPKGSALPKGYDPAVLPEGYDPAALDEEYAAARAAVTHGTSAARLSASAN